MIAKRNILGELLEGVAAMKSHREGKLTLRSYKVEPAPLPKVDSKLIRDSRKRLRCSRAVFARKLRINVIGAESPASTKPSSVGSSLVEIAILSTLEKMIPSSGASYRQALLDLQAHGRISYRGTAAELREVVREVLDHLAPDEAVMAAPGFKLEEGLKGPSMKQKVRFIMKARKVPDAGMKPAEDSVKHLHENIPSLGRSVYNRGSMDVHTARSREEVLNLKLYADAVLGELLEIHKGASPAEPHK